MAIIKLSIDTDGYYTEDDKEALLENFLAFILEADPDAIEGTESLSISSGDEVPADGKNDNESDTRARIVEALNKGTLSVTVTMADENGEHLFDTGDVPLAL